MLIGELAKRAGCDAGTIRYYEREGLLQKPYRTASGYRQYSEAHLVQLNFVRHCRTLGMTLMEIKLLQSLQADPQAPCGEISAMIDRHIGTIQQRIDSLHILEKQLAALRRCCNDNVTASECGILKMLVTAAEGGDGV